jgi:hypothetical protein
VTTFSLVSSYQRFVGNHLLHTRITKVNSLLTSTLIHDFTLPPLCKWDRKLSGILRSIEVPTFRDNIQVPFSRLSRNVNLELPFYAVQINPFRTSSRHSATDSLSDLVQRFLTCPPLIEGTEKIFHRGPMPFSVVLRNSVWSLPFRPYEFLISAMHVNARPSHSPYFRQPISTSNWVNSVHRSSFDGHFIPVRLNYVQNKPSNITLTESLLTSLASFLVIIYTHNKPKIQKKLSKTLIWLGYEKQPSMKLWHRLVASMNEEYVKWMREHSKIVKVKVKVKQSRYSPGVAQRVPGS